MLPTAILSVLSFRNIQSETFLAQKTFTENRENFQKELEDAFTKEQEKIFQETRAASLFLYELPKSLLEFGNAAAYKDVRGIKSIFLYNEGNLVYPDIASRRFYNTDGTANFPSKNANVQNMLGLVRLAYQNKDYNEALKYLKVLEQAPRLSGFLQTDLTRSVNLLHFEILVKQKRHQEAEEYCLSILSQFLQSESIEDIPSTKFFFESAFTQILSFDDLARDKREAFWNLRNNFNRQLYHMETLSKHKELFQDLLEDEHLAKNGILFRTNEGISLLRMSSPQLSGKQVVIAEIAPDAFRARILERLKSVAQGWKSIPFSITDENDSVLLGSIPDSSEILAQSHITSAYSWEISFYEKDMKEIRQESRQKMYLMYGLLFFSLITVVLGSIFMLRFVMQEHKLLAMKANFLSSVSHELKTPLTSIKMFAEMMARGRVAKVEKVQEYSGLIGKEANRLENLIGAILNYTRMEHGTGAFKWEKLDFSVCAKKVFEAVEDIGVEKGLEFSTRFEPNAFVMGDYTALYSLAQNLIENAIKYTNAPGNITINVHNEEDHTVFSVADTGIGIASSEQKNIFNDFYRVGDEMTRSTKGSGLGLAIVKRVVETHKATISLSSKPGKGSTFIVRFRKVD
ncbi:MAG: HAMP domain-containing histidine kinase [Fibrobacter sp.]|nr:HAMP domain-containing histidine kinase [Fibrobacter sp.]